MKSTKVEKDISEAILSLLETYPIIRMYYISNYIMNKISMFSGIQIQVVNNKIIVS